MSNSADQDICFVIELLRHCAGTRLRAAHRKRLAVMMIGGEHACLFFARFGLVCFFAASQ